MAAWRYEVYLRVLDIFHVSKTNRNFVSRSGHIMFCLLSKQWNTEPFHFNIFCSSNRDNVFARNLTSYFIGVHTINNLLLFLCSLVYFAWIGPLEIMEGEVTITEKKNSFKGKLPKKKFLQAVHHPKKFLPVNWTVVFNKNDRTRRFYLRPRKQHQIYVVCEDLLAFSIKRSSVEKKNCAELARRKKYVSRQILPLKNYYFSPPSRDF